MAKKTPVRQCLGCQEMMAKKDLIRIVRDNEGNFFVDVTGKMNGRGAYICRKSACLNRAVKNRGLERSFKQNIPDAVYETLGKELMELEQ